MAAIVTELAITLLSISLNTLVSNCTTACHLVVFSYQMKDYYKHEANKSAT